MIEAKDEMAKVVFTEKAWQKMEALVREYKGEVAWHGVAGRTDAVQNEYTVFDILVFPQTVGAASVSTGQETYQRWLMELDDSTFDRLRFQGHSHADFSSDPSTVDYRHQEEIVGQLKSAERGNRFYIFAILNKRGKLHITVYDADKNRVFRNGLVTVEILDGAYGIQGFLRQAREMVTDNPPPPKIPFLEPGTWEQWQQEPEEFWEPVCQPREEDGAYVKLTKEEIEASCSSVYEGILH